MFVLRHVALFKQVLGFEDSYFEVDSPSWSNRYSEVYWKTLPAVPLPAAIVERYKNSSIAITGIT